MFVSNQYHSDHTPFIYIVKSNKERSSMTEFVTIATALSLIHSQKEASQLIIADWETNTFEIHFQVKKTIEMIPENIVLTFDRNINGSLF